jgi:hypothetical protein
MTFTVLRRERNRGDLCFNTVSHTSCSIFLVSVFLKSYRFGTQLIEGRGDLIRNLPLSVEPVLVPGLSGDHHCLKRDPRGH